MNPAQELHQLPSLAKSNDANVQLRFNDILTRVSAWDVAALHQYYNDAVGSLTSCLSQPNFRVAQRLQVLRTVAHLSSLCSGHQLVGSTIRPLWLSVVAQANESVQFVEGSLGNIGVNPNIEDISLAITEQQERVRVFHILVDKIKELFSEIPLMELHTVFEAMFILFCGSMHKIQEFSPVFAGAGLMDLAKSNEELREYTTQLYVKLFKILVTSAFAFDPNSQCAEPVFICDGILSVCGLCEKKNFVMLAPGWACLKEIFNKYALQLRAGNFNATNLANHVLEKLGGALDEFIACAPVKDLAEPKYKKGSMLLKFFLPQLRTVCAIFGGDFPTTSSAVDNILDFLIKLKSSAPPSVSHYHTPPNVAKEVNLSSYQADTVFENLLPHLRNPALLLNKLNPSSPTSFDGGALGKLSLLSLVFLHFDKCSFDPQVISECAWWILDLLPEAFPELCTPVAPLKMGNNEQPQLSLFENVLKSLLHFFSYCPTLGVDLQLFFWECLSHPFPMCVQLGVEVASFALKNGDNDFTTQNINLFLDWITKENYDPSTENSQLGIHILQILANASLYLTPEHNGLITSRLFSPVNSYSAPDCPFPPGACAYFMYLRLSNFATAPYEVTSEVLPMCISKLNYCINNSSPVNLLTSTVFVLRTIFMDKKYAKSNVLPALAQKISQATVQLLTTVDPYPAHLPDIIDLAASLLVDYFNPQQRETVVVGIKNIIDANLNKENALAVADFLGNFIGFNVETSWAEHLKSIFYKIFSLNDEATLIEVMRNYYHMLEFSAFRELLPGFLPENMKIQMRAFIMLQKIAKTGLIHELSDQQSLISQKEQLVSELQPQLAKRKRITRESFLSAKDSPVQPTPTLQPTPTVRPSPHPSTNGVTKTKMRDDVPRIAQVIRSNLALLRPYLENPSKEDALFIHNETKDLGVSFNSLEDLLKSAIR